MGRARVAAGCDVLIPRLRRPHHSAEKGLLPRCPSLGPVPVLHFVQEGSQPLDLGSVAVIAPQTPSPLRNGNRYRTDYNPRQHLSSTFNGP